ncbi:hypothetical protein [Stackebrandtia albiflava]|nr:hypothetical protein [Stackebrandtia albiflava]
MADRLSSMVVDVRSPDGRIRATLRHRDELTLYFSGDAYRHYQERTLEYQLARLATLMWVDYQRQYDEAVAAVVGHPVEEDRESWNANRRRFREEQAETKASGMSPGNVVYVENVGMRNWHVVVRDGTVARVPEEEFAAECVGAFHTLMRDHADNMRRLRAKHYGPGFAGTHRSA